MDQIGMHAAGLGFERLARLYRALSQTNQAIVRIRDRDSLFEEVCRIAVELGGLRSATIGLLEEGRAHVRRVATYGEDRWSFASGASFALREGSRIIGCMTLFSDTAGFFDKALVELLDEMAADVSFALENLARDRRRAQAEASLRQLSQAVEQSPAATVITDIEGRILYANPRFTEVSGYTIEEVRGQPPSVIKGGHTPRHVYADLWSTLRSGAQWRGEMQNRRKDGRLYWEYEVISAVKDAAGEVVNFIAVKEDITERKRQELELVRMNRTLRMISECHQVLFVAKDEGHLLQSICRVIVRAGGYACAQVAFEAGDPPVASASAPGFEARTALEGCTTLRLALAKNREPLGTLTIHAGEHDAFTAEERHLLGEMADDLAYGIASLRLAEAVRVRERAIESSINGIMISDSCLPDRPIVYVNPAFERITGYSAHEAVGRNGRFMLGEDLGQRGLAELRTALRQGRPAQVVLRCQRKDGSVFWNELAIAQVRDEAGRVTHVVSIVNDVTDRVRYESDLAHSATHDSLTGLANRNLLDDRLDQAIAAAQRYGRSMAVVYVDLDHFKMVNESLGYRAGDELLRQVARRLLGVVREVDTVARAGGDEFVIVLYDIQDPDEVAANLQRMQDAMREPFAIEGQEVHVRCSLGASFYPRDGRDALALLRNADAAMHDAKEQGRNGFQLYAARMNPSGDSRLATVRGLRRAIDHGDFELHYQPVVAAASGAILGAEALLRWRDPQRGLVGPARFIAVAEETGLIVPMGEWALDAACAQNAAWQAAGHPRVAIAVNLSARQFQQHDIAGVVERALRRHGLDPGCLELELTESTLVKNVSDAVVTLDTLRALGVRLALDDFGTGYSSLAYLKRFPVHKLKIDQSFVRDIPHDADDAAIVTAVIAMARSLGLRVIAEGVETREQVDFLRGERCDELQGHYLGRPMPAHEFAALLAAAKR